MIARMVRTLTALVLLEVLATGLAAQEGARWFARASDAGLRIVGPSTTVVRERFAGPITTPPGDFEVHFARDAAGKPDSLAVSVPDGATVVVAVEHASESTPTTLEAVDSTSYLVAATAVAADSAARLGLVARRTDDDNWYRFVWDRERGQFRLERSIAGAVVVIRAAEAPRGDDEPHELALQVEGFRLRAFLDDELVLQALDGAHLRGGYGTWQSAGARVEWRRTVVERPAPPRPSSAIVVSAGAATFSAATCAAAGHYFVLELALDRPHPLVPTTVAGLEPWLLQRRAAPSILRGDFGRELGRIASEELPFDGRVSRTLGWPDGAILGGQAALVRALVVSPDGDRLVSRTPSVSLRL